MSPHVYYAVTPKTERHHPTCTFHIRLANGRTINKQIGINELVYVPADAQIINQKNITAQLQMNNIRKFTAAEIVRYLTGERKIPVVQVQQMLPEEDQKALKQAVVRDIEKEVPAEEVLPVIPAEPKKAPAKKPASGSKK